MQVYWSGATSTCCTSACLSLRCLISSGRRCFSSSDTLSWVAWACAPAASDVLATCNALPQLAASFGTRAATTLILAHSSSALLLHYISPSDLANCVISIWEDFAVAAAKLLIQFLRQHLERNTYTTGTTGVDHQGLRYPKTRPRGSRSWTHTTCQHPHCLHGARMYVHATFAVHVSSASVSDATLHLTRALANPFHQVDITSLEENESASRNRSRVSVDLRRTVSVPVVPIPWHVCSAPEQCKHRPHLSRKQPLLGTAIQCYCFQN